MQSRSVTVLRCTLIKKYANASDIFTDPPVFRLPWGKTPEFVACELPRKWGIRYEESRGKGRTTNPLPTRVQYLLKLQTEECSKQVRNRFSELDCYIQGGRKAEETNSVKNLSDSAFSGWLRRCWSRNRWKQSFAGFPGSVTPCAVLSIISWRLIREFCFDLFSTFTAFRFLYY